MFNSKMALSLLVPLLFGSAVAEVKVLNDATFEHETQASTGATTGSWLVLFRTKTERCAKLQEILETAEEDLRQEYVIPASVDLAANKGLQERFNLKKAPATLLVHKNKLFRYSGKDDLDALLAWVKSSMEGKEVGEKVPPEPSFLDKLMDQVRKLFSGPKESEL
eukprot:TRINITY_DN26362_c0_g1_i1.p1 TRINITY_DN26362_c0_g1~~TRINITY_DN26362_c0_g1_i1.p1  ORF type:complete len:165 (+),score=37.32 TRINITY_DN26362_c0_g1_i1:88-582(+)